MSGDFISREALRDRVDEIIKTNHLRPDYVWFTPNGVKVLALEIPAADVVEVVRCRECYFRELDGADIPVCTGAMAYSYTSDDWFCADGKHKDGGQDDG